ncbi:MAG: NUDIX hydrolase [Rhodospirillales bacterium]|nr:NUDIX hydrolase [Rhodospirillales bacterium]
MTAVNTFAINPDFDIRLVDAFETPPQIAARVDEIWAREKTRLGDALVNGPTLSLVDYQPHRLTLQPAEYRHVMARRHAPDLVDAGLAVRPLGVTGVLSCSEGIVLGRRGAKVASDAGVWEAAPAGGLDRSDPAAQVLEELREELGLEASRVAPPVACGLVEDVASGVFDIVFRLHTAATAEEVLAAHKTMGTDEYAELAIVKQADMATFLEAERDHLLPALRPMLHLAGVEHVG